MTRLLPRFLRPYRGLLLLIVALVAAQAIGNLYLPNLNADIINNGVVEGDTDYIVRTGGGMLALTAFIVACAIAATLAGAYAAMAVGRDLRAAIFGRVMDFSAHDASAFGTPSLITRNTNDVQQVQVFLAMGLNMLLFPPMMAVGGVIMALGQDVPLSLTLLFIVPVVVEIVAFMTTRALPLFRSMQVRTDRVNQVMRETLAGVRVIRAFVRTGYEERRFDGANHELTETTLSVNRLYSVAMPLLLGSASLATVVVVWFGGLRIDSGEMPIGNLTAFLLYMTQVLYSLLMGVFASIMIPRAAAAAERIAAVLDREPELCDPDSPAELPDPRGVVEFRDVEFRYPGAEEPVLAGVTFTAEPGRTTAIVGSTGSGKSTLVDLLARFHDVTGGAVTIDGVDVRSMRQDDLWRRVGLVPQKAYLFSGTVGSNLRFGDEAATDEQLWRALEIAQAREFVEAADGGLEAPIDQGGTNVSGGQRQRLAIARAIVKRPKVYVFDDAFSALDFRTDQRLRAALRAEIRDATVIIVAQRVGTIMRADQIVVLDGGRIVGRGTHDELMGSCETYREIVFSQLSREDVA